MRERLKVPRKGSEIEPETIYLQEVGVQPFRKKELDDGVPFVE